MNPPSSRGAKLIGHISGPTVLAIAVSGVILIGLFILWALLPPVVGFVVLCFGVAVKGSASFMEAVMKTEGESYWRSDAKEATAWLNVIAVALGFPPLLAAAAENLFAVL